MYDVIIIGAGPTGSSAAKELASNGYKVLIIEKFRLPRNKSCSGVLIKKSVDLVASYFGEPVPQSVMCSPVDSKGMVFTNDVGQEYRYEQDGLNIWRSTFDQWLALQAVKAGAELRDETSALGCEEQSDHVVVTMKGQTEYTEQAKIVIACDGALSSMRRKLRNEKLENTITYQTFNKGTIDLDPHFFYAYLQPEFSEHDAWFNVKDDYLIFGVSVRDSSKIPAFYSRFLSYMKEKHNAVITEQVKEDRWIMPYIHPGCPVDYGTGRVLFAGETAGFLNPMGEGISSGLECGHSAATAIETVNSFDDAAIPKIHEEYKRNTAAIKVYMERQWRFVGNMSERFKHMK